MLKASNKVFELRYQNNFAVYYFTANIKTKCNISCLKLQQCLGEKILV